MQTRNDGKILPRLAHESLIIIMMMRRFVQVPRYRCSLRASYLFGSAKSLKDENLVAAAAAHVANNV